MRTTVWVKRNEERKKAAERWRKILNLNTCRSSWKFYQYQNGNPSAENTISYTVIKLKVVLLFWLNWSIPSTPIVKKKTCSLGLSLYWLGQFRSFASAGGCGWSKFKNSKIKIIKLRQIFLGCSGSIAHASFSQQQNQHPYSELFSFWEEELFQAWVFQHALLWDWSCWSCFFDCIRRSSCRRGLRRKKKVFFFFFLMFFCSGSKRGKRRRKGSKRDRFD